MVLFTRLSPHECINRLTYLGGNDPNCVRMVADKKYRFRNGDSRLCVNVSGVDFDIELWGRKYSTHLVTRFVGTIEVHAPSGGSIIRGGFERTQHMLAAVVAVVGFAAFPWLMMMLAAATGGSPERIVNSGLGQYYGFVASVAFLLVCAIAYSRQLVTGFLKQLLEAKTKVS